MVILHTYLRHQGNIIATVPFRYNNGDDTPLEAREVILDVDTDSSYGSIQQALMEKFDKEKIDNGETNEFPGGNACITIV
jgi:hypothetical protein